MKKILTISDLDGFEDMCNQNVFTLTAGDVECKRPDDNRPWWEVENEKALEKYLDSHGPNSTGGSSKW